MNKAIFLLIFISVGICLNAQTEQRKTIKAGLGLGHDSRGNNAKEILSFNKDGEITYSENERAPYPSETYDRGYKKGNYYIGNNNIVYITWNNGFEETAKLTYNSSGRAVVIFREKTFNQFPWDD